MASTLTAAVLAELEALRVRVARLEAANQELRAKVDGLEVVLAPAFPRHPRQRQALTILRNHRDWSDQMVAGICGLAEAEVASVRETLEAAA